ncbi:FAD-dependent monooxygenase [Yinghuangia aomiensis]
MTRDVVAHLDDTLDFYLDQAAQVVMDRWSNGRVVLLGDAAFSSSPMSGQGTGLALVGAYVLAGELAAAGWDPGAAFARARRGCARSSRPTRRSAGWNARSRQGSRPDAEPGPDFAGEWFMELVGRAINGVELPDYAEVPDSAASAGSVPRT